MRHSWGALLAVPLALAVVPGVLAQEVADRIWTGGPVLPALEAMMFWLVFAYCQDATKGSLEPDELI